MCIAVMMGNVSPMVLMFNAMQRKQQAPGTPLSTLVFVAAYFVVWFAFALCVSIGPIALHEASLLLCAWAH